MAPDLLKVWKPCPLSDMFLCVSTFFKASLSVNHLVVRLEVVGKEGGSGWERARIEEGFEGPDWAQEVVGQGGQLDPMM